VLVTGAAAGIGRATALAFTEAGARVVAVDRDAEGGARTAETARSLGATPSAWGEVVDVGDEQAMEEFTERITAETGVADVLVDNAGIGPAGSFLDMTSEERRKVLGVDLWGVIHACRISGARTAGRGQGDHIVVVASAAAHQPSRALPASSTSKAAALMLGELRTGS